MLTINQAASYLGVCPDTVRRHIRLGLLTAERQPRGSKYHWLVDVTGREPVGASFSDDRQPTREEFERLNEMVVELRNMLRVTLEQLEARRQEVWRLLTLLGDATVSPAMAASDGANSDKVR